jgi:hypothetical protein
MKTITKVFVVAALVFIFASIMLSLSYAEQQTQQMKPAEKMKPVPPKLAADLKIDNIYGDSYCACKSALVQVNAILMVGIYVSVSNMRDVLTPATISVTFFNYRTGQLMTVKENVTLNPSERRVCAVVVEPVLARKSTGIKAEIQPSGNVVDSNPANNVMTVYECNLHP